MTKTIAIAIVAATMLAGCRSTEEGRWFKYKDFECRAGASELTVDSEFVTSVGGLVETMEAPPVIPNGDSGRAVPLSELEVAARACKLFLTTETVVNDS